MKARARRAPAPVSLQREAPAPPGLTATVVVPVLNGAKTLTATLASLDAQTLSPERFEIIVVDDGSRDGTRELVRAFGEVSRARVRLVERPHAGPAAARNAGIAAGRSDVVAFTDSDVEAAPDWLERALDRLSADPALSAVEGRTVPKGRPGTLTHQMHNETGGLFMTCNMVYRRAAIDQAGGFDERFRTAFLEDSDLAFRVISNGGRIVFDPDVLAFHQVLFHGRRKFWKDARKRQYVPLIMRAHPDLYRRLLRPVVPAFPAIYVEEMLGLATLATALATRAWAAAVPAGLVLAIALRRVAHAHRARDPLSWIQAASMPFVQGFWVLAGRVRFGRVARYRATDHRELHSGDGASAGA